MTAMNQLLSIRNQTAAFMGLAMLIGCIQAVSGQTTVDMSAPGTSIDRDILGTNYFTQRFWAPVADRTMLTGPAGGLTADDYNWQKEVPYPWWNTIGVLQNIRDSGSRPMFMVNMRGIGNLTTPNDLNTFYYTDTSVGTLTTLASEWVRYTNFILQNGLPYAQQSPGDQAILDKITTFGPLPPPNQPPLPTVKYWEIGNEPDVYLSGIQFGTPSYPASDYVNRYVTITNAMKAVDPTIKVGPAISAMTAPVGPNNWESAVTQALLQSNATVDFWGYHSYDHLDNYFVANGTAAQTATMEAELRQVRTYQTNLYNLQRSFFTKYGRDPNQVEFRATEWSPMGTGTNTTSAPTMYQALAFTETIFTYAELGLKSANYWGLLAYEPSDPKGMYNLWPMVKVWQELNQNIGDGLVSSIIDDANNRRVYVTRDSITGKVTVWGLNFDNDADTSLDLGLLNLTGPLDATLSILNDGPGTTLWTADAAKWTTQNLVGFNPGFFNFSIPHASIVMLELQAVPEPSSLALLGAGMAALMVRRRSVLN
jgi:hypothetical protein